MKRGLQITVVSVMLLAISCMELDELLMCRDVSAANPELGQTFIVREGDGVDFQAEQFTVQFLSKVSESRCTSVCVWEGEASVRVELEAADMEAEQFVLSTTSTGDWQSAASYGAFEVHLEDVTPYPEQNREIQGSSCAVLTVRKLEPGV